MLKKSTISSQLQTKINALTNNSDINEILLLSNAVVDLDDGIEISVSLLDDLPDSYRYNVPNGTMIFVDEVSQPVTCSSNEWFDLSGSLVKGFGTLWGAGWNTGGQIGNNTTTSYSSPASTIGVMTGASWKQVSVSGGQHTAAIKTDGTLWTWGSNTNGELGTGNTTARSSPGTTAGGGNNWKQVSVAYAMTAAIKTDGSLWTWGLNSYGILGSGAVANRSSPETIIGGSGGWIKVDCVRHDNARRSVLAIKGNGTLWAWGYNSFGQLGDNTTVSKSSPVTTAGGGTTWTQCSAGGYISAGIKSDGTLWTWGYNMLGDNATASRSSPGTTASGGTSWAYVDCGNLTAVAIKTDGTGWAWGNGASGALCHNDTTNYSSPVSMYGGYTWSKVVMGGSAGLGIVKGTGAVMSWGANTNGVTMRNTTTGSSSTAVTISGITKGYDISLCGGSNSFVLGK